MRWVTCRVRDRPEPRVGRVVEDRVYLLEGDQTLLGLLGDDGERLARAGERALSQPSEIVALGEIHLLPPIPRPPSVRDFYAFEQHVRTAAERRGTTIDPEWYQLPVFYFTNPAALVGHRDPVAIPPDCQALDYELEVAAIIGRGGANLRPADAARSVVGFSILNDWSARDIQRREMRVGLGPAKGKDFATSLGPYLVTRDEVETYSRGKSFDLTMTARVNGKEYSRASLADIYWSFGEMIAFASRGTRVEVGDVLGSGTCGTGCILELAYVHGAEAYPWLKPGDVVELTVDHVGTLSNHIIVGEPSSSP